MTSAVRFFGSMLFLLEDETTLDVKYDVMAIIYKYLLPAGPLRWLFAMIPLLFALPAPAPDPVYAGQASAPGSSLYRKDRISLQVVSGVLTAPTCIGPDTDKFDYVQTNLRLGWMLNSPGRLTGTLFRGNFESILEVTHSHVYQGPGNVITGVSGLLRYNLVPYDFPLSAYLQLGGGIVYTDIYKDRSQDAVGQAMEFTPQASVALRYRINDAWSVEAEGMFHHISNAGLSERNLGLNAMGGFIGFTYFFDDRPQIRREASQHVGRLQSSIEEFPAGSMPSGGLPPLKATGVFRTTGEGPPPRPEVGTENATGRAIQTESSVCFHPRKVPLLDFGTPLRQMAIHSQVPGPAVDKNPETFISILPFKVFPSAYKKARAAGPCPKAALCGTIMIHEIRMVQKDAVVQDSKRPRVAGASQGLKKK